MRPDPSHFRLWHEVDVRFKDIDLGGHAHHSMALVYFEEARSRYWREVVGVRSLADVDFILGEATVRYHARVLYPLRLRVGVRVSRIGRKHFVMEYLARDAQENDLVSGETVMVMYDYAAGRSKAIPPEVRSALEAWEGEGGP